VNDEPPKEKNALALAELQTAESSGYHKGRIRMCVTLKMAKPRSVALKTAEDPGREGFAAKTLAGLGLKKLSN
jgi:hypothetical protein